MVNADSVSTCSVSFSPPNEILSFQKLYEEKLLEFMLKLHANSGLARSKVFEIVNDINNIILKTISEEFQNIFKNFFNGAFGADFRSFNKIIKNSFSDINTEALLITTLKARNLYTNWTEFEIGKIDGKMATGLLLPIEFQIKMFFELPNVFNSFMQNLTEHEQSIGYKSIVNGDRWKEIKSNYEETDILVPMFVFSDDCEPDNPIGAHKGCHKITCVYYSFPLLPTETLSKVCNIFVGMVFESKYLNVSSEKCYSKFVEVLNSLAKNGIQICVDGKTYNLYFVVCWVIISVLTQH